MADSTDQAGESAEIDLKQLLDQTWSKVGRKKSGGLKRSASALLKVDSFANTDEAAATEEKVDKAPTPLTKAGGLGSWSRLLSKGSVDEPSSTPASSTTSAPVEAAVEAPVVDATPKADEEDIEVDLASFLESSSQKAAVPAPAPAPRVEEEDECPLGETDEAAAGDKDVVDKDAMEVEAPDVGPEEVVLSDAEEDEEMLEYMEEAEEEQEVQQEVQEGDVEATEEAAEVAEAEADASAEGVAEPEETEASEAAPAEAAPAAEAAAADAAPAEAKTAAADGDDSDDCMIIEDSGAEFRAALDEMPDGKVMKTQAKAAAKAGAAAGPKPPNAPPPRGASGPKLNAPAKATVAAAKPKADIVRTMSGNVGQPPQCKSGHGLKSHPNDGGYACDECNSPNTAYRCVAGCDFDLCQPCYSKKVTRVTPAKAWNSPGPKADSSRPQHLKNATPFNAAGGGKGASIKPGMQNKGNNSPKAAGLVRTISGSSQQGNQPKAGIIQPKAGNVAQNGRIPSGIGAAKAGSNQPKAGGPAEMKISGGRIIRTNSGNLPGGQIAPIVRTNSAPIARTNSGPIGRTNSGNWGQGSPLVRTNSGNAGGKGQGKGQTIQPGGAIQPGGQKIGAIQPAGQPIQRANSAGSVGANADPKSKRARTDTGPIAAVDAEGRQYNLTSVVVNFANVGASYAKKVLKRNADDVGAQMLFDWEGVRRCVMYLTKNLGLQVIGVIYENFWATDNNSSQKKELPADIRKACVSVEETPRIIGRNHSSADDEMTIKCAYHRNCRFMDNDNYRDWKQQLRDDKCRVWLDKCQDLLHMRYYFDSSIGVFETLDGNVPPGLLAPDGKRIPAAVSKKQLWTASNK